MSTKKDNTEYVGHQALNCLSKPQGKETNRIICYHTHILALVLLCAFTVILTIMVFDSMFEIKDRPYHEAFITKSESVTLGVPIVVSGS